MLRCIFEYTGTVVSKHYSVFIFRVNRVFRTRRLFDLEHTDTTVMSNVSNYLSADTTQHLRRPEPLGKQCPSLITDVTQIQVCSVLIKATVHSIRMHNTSHVQLLVCSIAGNIV